MSAAGGRDRAERVRDGSTGAGDHSSEEGQP
jgi:hypothetical protein